MAAGWGYSDTDGPQEWHKNFPIAKDGVRQSPVAIQSSKTEKMDNCPELEWKYLPGKTIDIENTGSSWKVNVDGSGSSLKGGALEGEYQLWQYHAHWGSDSSKGSEHTVDGKSYPAELHLVHWNTSKYSSPEDAAGQPDGLAVLGMFIEIGKKNEEFDKLLACFDKIKYKGQRSSLDCPVDPSKFLPSTKSFWTYEGSLTTPPLFESVIWTVFKEPIQMSEQQISAMRSLYFCTEDKGKEDGCKHVMINNYRPPVPLGSRVVKYH